MSGKKSRQLSHSAVGRYSMCAKSYDFHYNKRLRPVVTSAALLFGSALDTACNQLLDGKTSDEALAAFEKAWSFARVGNTMQPLKENTNIVYAGTDFDSDLLLQEDKEALGGNVEERLADIQDLKKRRGWDNLDPETQKWYNSANWTSLRRKGRLMVEAYSEKVMPHFKKVLTFQRRISLANEDGDSVVGFIDLVAELQDGRIVVFDNKTSAREYDKDAVITSAQLALYMHAVYPEFKTRWAGFIVIRKGIVKNREKLCRECGFQAEKGARHKTCTNEVNGKRCGGEWIETISPEVDINILIDEISPALENLVLENFADIAHLIKQEIYPRNLNSCSQWYGGDCAYKKLCMAGDMRGLEYVDEEKK